MIINNDSTLYIRCAFSNTPMMADHDPDHPNSFYIEVGRDPSMIYLNRDEAAALAEWILNQLAKPLNPTE